MASSRPLLILDLDETLIHGSESRLHRDADFRVGPFHVYRRPHLEEFLTGVAEHCSLAIWSSASSGYVAAIAEQLAAHVPKWEFVWSRQHCVERLDPELRDACFLKDLKKVKRLGYPLDRVLIVDDSREKLARNYGNAIYVAPFTGEQEDQELLMLGTYIASLRQETNFRKIEKRGWRTKLT
jgi:RNA polymerase II subunit A small phosphatase-like protein